jgi:hypothetical protein
VDVGVDLDGPDAAVGANGMRQRKWRDRAAGRSAVYDDDLGQTRSQGEERKRYEPLKHHDLHLANAAWREFLAGFFIGNGARYMMDRL